MTRGGKRHVISNLATDEQIREDVEEFVEAMLAKFHEILHDPSLSPDARQKKLMQLKIRRRKQSKFSTEDDYRILHHLFLAESQSGGVKAGAKALFEEMKKEGHKVQSAEALRQRYYALKKLMLDAAEKFEKGAELNRV